jgi:hypothetical protein
MDVPSHGCIITPLSFSDPQYPEVTVFGRLLCASLLLTGLGCFSGKSLDKWTKSRPKTTPVQGTVTFQGNPLANATVVFSPRDGQYEAIGMTDNEGKYSLMTFQAKDGAVPGEYLVAITCVKIEGPSSGANLSETDSGLKETSLIPIYYGQLDKSGLTAKVIEGESNRIDFPLN